MDCGHHDVQGGVSVVTLSIFGGGGTVRFSLGIAIFYRGHLYLPCSNSRARYLPLDAILG